MSREGEITNAIRRQIDGFHPPAGSFAEHASVEAIDAAIRDADGAQRRLGLHIGWLQDVKRERKLQIQRGERSG